MGGNAAAFVRLFDLLGNWRRWESMIDEERHPEDSSSTSHVQPGFTHIRRLFMHATDVPLWLVSWEAHAVHVDRDAHLDLEATERLVRCSSLDVQLWLVLIDRGPKMGNVQVKKNH